MKKQTLLFVLLGMLLASSGFSNEVLNHRPVEIMIKKHPRTGNKYIAVTAEGVKRKDLLSTRGESVRPDYRMLQKGVSAEDVGYAGPYSSKKKIYILAGTLATAGVASAIVAPIAFPAAAGAGAAGSAVGPAVGAGALGAATAGGIIALDPSRLPDDYSRETETRLLETQTDFFEEHVSSPKNRII